MDRITSIEQTATLKDNCIIGKIQFIDSEVVFGGKNNVLYASTENSDQYITLRNTRINFAGDNNLCYINMSRHSHEFDAELYYNSYLHVGSDCFFNSNIKISCVEQCNVFIGDRCTLSYSITFETSDWHLIFDIQNYKRINPAKSILIGDHVWIGHNASVLKGTNIGSGAVIGANALVAGKRIPSNTIFAGNPAKMIKSDVFFAASPPAHLYRTSCDIEYNNSFYGGDISIFTYNKNETIDFCKFEMEIQSFTTAMEKALFLANFNKDKKKNRFFIENQ